MMLHHDSASSHTAAITGKFLKENVTDRTHADGTPNAHYYCLVSSLSKTINGHNHLIRIDHTVQFDHCSATCSAVWFSNFEDTMRVFPARGQPSVPEAFWTTVTNGFA
ncbi:hypothetical protein EVAR_89355_1 [Eumeta japonica]|uniref:Uncharacterized protein n=1 Tax=Eumeta variegata TaxID=151549 RepID=A0A4C1Y0R9_EUMVA|nr:hypothetical protein EVAR_89355_1 [Eumeta japonica]